MYTGEQTHQLDAKNRIRIPAMFKIDPDEKFVFCKGTAPCIYVLPKRFLEEKAKEFSSVPFFNESMQEALSEFASSFYPVEADAQGRILIPQRLREYAHIDKNVITIGVFDRLEIWSEEVKNERRNKKSYTEFMKVLDSSEK